MKRMILFAAILSVLTFGLIAIGSPAVASHVASHGGRAPHCGDPCEVEGASGSCVYYGGSGALFKTTAICQNGYWTGWV
jgi:hypothetical protein